MIIRSIIMINIIIIIYLYDHTLDNINYYNSFFKLIKYNARSVFINNLP